MTNKLLPLEAPLENKMSLTEQKTGVADWHQIREAVLERDNYRCTDCTKPKEAVESFHIDHNVPRGRGGSDRFTNLRTLCKRCHEAKHGDGYAPMLEFQSTGRMDNYTFHHFKHFFDEILPAMGRSIGVRFDPKFKLDEKRNVWFVSLGNVRLADATLATFDEEYDTLRAAGYM
jgi:hypothetical protein